MDLGYYDYIATITGRWLQSGIGPREAIAELQPACGVVETDGDTIRRLEARWQEEHNALDIVFGILGGPWNRLAGFDCEDVHSPADNTNIVGYLAAATSNKLAVENVKARRAEW